MYTYYNSEKDYSQKDTSILYYLVYISYDPAKKTEYSPNQEFWVDILKRFLNCISYSIKILASQQ